MEWLLAMWTDRPYVIAFLASFLLISRAERGWRRTLFWLVSGTFLGWLAELSSVRNGFPFGFYTYRQENFPRELWIGGIPFFASVSFSFMTYFGFSVATTFLSPLRRRGFDLERLDDLRVATSLRVLALAAVLTTWMDTVIDPITHLGRYWFLGELYAYHSEGIHFDVPLSNYGGWLLTSAGIVFVNQRFDAWLARREAEPPRGLGLPFRPLWALASCVGNFLFMLGINLFLLASDRVPGSEPLRWMLASGLTLTSLFVVLAIVRIRAGLRRSAPAPAAAG